ncbi:MAG TPA: metallophosphoesterase [Candidatus Eisenbacteria bacterium]|nr:metallophosphoesterase [Candidatus Eisenbacteria bacterium]
MAIARFLQISDLHLGAPFRWLPAAQREERRRDQRSVLEHAVLQAIERDADAILIPGDLFDQEGVDAGTLAFALGAFDVNGCPPVFIAPGNHDPASERSLYWNERLLKARAMRWPAHVHVFASPDWSSRSLPSLPGIRVWGRSFIGSVETRERPLAPSAIAGVGRPDPMGFDLALFHGSREGRCPPGQRVTAPFSDAEVAEAPFAYHAVGHYHASSRHELNHGPSAGARLAYAGSAAAINTTEIGPHGALEVRIEYGRRQPFVEVEVVELDPRRVHDVTAEITLATSPDQVDRRVRKAMDDAGVRPDDIVTVRLAGRLARGVRVGGPSPELRASVFHLKPDLSRLRPDYDLEAYRVAEPTTTEDRFARSLLDEHDRETDPERRAVIESALYYGLDAFRLREVVPAYEELGE